MFFTPKGLHSKAQGRAAHPGKQSSLGVVPVPQRTPGGQLGTGLPRLKCYPMFPAWFRLLYSVLARFRMFV